jgi:cyclic pyranopterin monophosphate synthase
MVTQTTLRVPLPVMSESELTHIDAAGNAHMVDVANREVTTRTATTVGQVLLSSEVVALLRDGAIPKGDVLATARIAGIMATKRTPDLIPLCHPIAVHGVSVDLTVVDEGVTIKAVVKTADRTGVEMEALTAVAVAGLTVIDMVKALDPSATITDVKMIHKDGGRNGEWTRS